MPYLRRDAPASVPDAETLDELLGLPNRKSKKTRAVKTRDQLSETQRKRKHLVSLGIRQTRIQGDPFGMLHSWAGNIAHPEDERIVSRRLVFHQLGRTTIHLLTDRLYWY